MCRANQNAYHREQAENAPNYYLPAWQNYSDFSWENNQDQFYDPCPSYPSENWYQPPSQEEDTSKLEEFLSKYLEQQEERRVEELLTNFISQNEVRMAIQQASIRNLESQMEQLTNIILNQPQSTLPSLIKINLIEEGEEHGTMDTQGWGEELQ